MVSLTPPAVSGDKPLVVVIQACSPVHPDQALVDHTESKRFTHTLNTFLT